MNETIIISCVQLQRTLDEHRARLDARGAVLIVPPVNQQLTEPELIELIPGVDGIVAGDDHLTRAVLERADRLRIVSKWGVGTDAIDHAAAAELGIRVTNTPGMFGDEVADVVIGYLILLARHLHRTDSAVRGGNWYKPEGVSLGGRTLGIVGLGHIGQAVARRGLAMGMRIVGSEVAAANAAAAASLGVEVMDLDTVLASSDAISLNSPLTPETRHLLDADRLARMRRGAWVINTGRGGLIDEPALIDALHSGQVGAAALDVFEVEPLPMDSPLRELDQVILGSHNSSNTLEAGRRTSERAIDNLIRGLDEVRR
ncbi:MAG TPA: phosphoglycerate dehydrogenase [Candidatus Limnocylindrales bacterium]|nr:phosphoglycerate dehydrogenase [Candidatus Limnocylindrales bacterium]